MGNTGFDCLITRLNQTRGWGQNPTIYWCVQEEEEEEVEEEEEEEEEEEADGNLYFFLYIFCGQTGL